MAFCAKCGAQIPAGATFCPACGSPVEATGGQTPPSGLSTLTQNVNAQQYWMKRFLAYVIDAVIVYAVIGLAVAAAAIPAFISGILVPGSAPPVSVFGSFFAAFAGVILLLYFAIAEATYGRTVGKSVMGLRVITAGGGAPDIKTSVLRNLSKIYWVLLLLDVILGLALEMGYMKKLSDKYLGTSVVQR